MAQPTDPDVSHRPVPSTRAGLASWLLELGDDIGRPLDGDRTLVPLTVTQLNIRTGRSPKCGTLFGRVKALAPAVTLHRGGITIDRSALEREAAGVTASPTAARSQGPDSSPAVAAAPGLTGQLLQEACRVAEQAAALAAAAMRLATEACAMATTENLPVVAGPARDRDLAAARGSRDRGLPPEEGGREVSSCSETQTPPSLTALPRPAKAAATAADPSPQPPVGPDRLDELLQPLIETCRRTGLVAVSDTRGLRSALAPYSPDQIRHAVVLTSRLTKSGVITSRPIGWLIARAREGDIDYFPPAEPAATPPPPAVCVVETDPETVAAEKALATAGVDDLALLDEWIRTAPHHARIRHLIFDRPGMLQTARLEAWRALQEKAS